MRSCIECFVTGDYPALPIATFKEWIAEWIDEDGDIEMSADDFYDKITNDGQVCFVADNVVYLPFAQGVFNAFDDYYEASCIV